MTTEAEVVGFTQVTYRVLGKRLLVERLPRESFAGAFHIPERYKSEQLMHRVLAVGPKVSDVAPGNHVLIDQYAMQGRAELGGDRFIIDEKDVCLVVL